MGDLIEKRFLLSRLQALTGLFRVAGELTEFRVHAVHLLEDDGQQHRVYAGSLEVLQERRELSQICRLYGSIMSGLGRILLLAKRLNSVLTVCDILAELLGALLVLKTMGAVQSEIGRCSGSMVPIMSLR